MDEILCAIALSCEKYQAGICELRITLIDFLWDSVVIDNVPRHAHN